MMSANAPLVNIHLDILGYSPIFSGLMFSLVCLVYALSMPLVAEMRTVIPKRGVIVIGLSLMGSGVFITGIPHIGSYYNPGLMAILGFCMFGTGMGMVTIPVMPEILEGVEARYGQTFKEKELYNHLAGYFIMC